MCKFEITLARRYLRPARREAFVSAISLFSVLGITLGVATLILVTSLMNGIRAEMTQLFIGIDGPLNMYTQPLEPIMAEQTAKRLQNKAGVSYALPKVTGQVMATHQGRALGVQVAALAGDDFSAKPMLKGKLPASFDGLLLGEALAKSLGVKAGDSIKLISPQGRHSIAGFVPRIKSFRVAGTLKLGMHAYDSSLILMPFERALRFFKPPQVREPMVVQFELGTEDVSQAKSIAQNLQDAYNGNADFYDWQTSNRGLFVALDVQRNVMLLILALIILVAAFNIISSLIMLVQDKRADIAILRTMGASRGQLMRAFCLSGSLLGLIGTALGTGLGLLAAANLEAMKRGIEGVIGQKILVEEVYFLSSLPTQTDPADVLLIVVASLAISVLATLYPARRAASISPAEALRYG